MIQRVADELMQVVDEAVAELRSIPEAAAAAKARPEVWSIKEIIGHLIDSASNNHQRFVRAQQTDRFASSGYEQDVWVRSQGYQERAWRELIEFWALYNHHLSHVIRGVSEIALATPCQIEASKPVTLRFLIEDYVAHLRHHLKQIDERRTARS